MSLFKIDIFIFFVLTFFSVFTLSHSIDCRRDCGKEAYTNPHYKPQECAEKCGPINYEEEDEETIEVVLEEVHSMKILVIVLLALVILMILLLIISFARNSKFKLLLRKFYRKIRNKGPEDIEKSKEAKAGTRIANYASQSSPVTSLDRGPQRLNTSQVTPHQRGHQRTSSIIEGAPLEKFSPTDTRVVGISRQRGRMPSESTCPDEPQVEVSGYDNLALSTSTINFHSRPSSPNSPPLSPADTVSSSDTMATLNTTMTTIHLNSAGNSIGTPDRNAVGKKPAH